MKDSIRGFIQPHLVLKVEEMTRVMAGPEMQQLFEQSN